MGPVGGIGCLVPRSGPNLALFESCGAMDGESCVRLTQALEDLVYRTFCFQALASILFNRVFLTKIKSILPLNSQSCKTNTSVIEMLVKDGICKGEKLNILCVFLTTFINC